MADRFLPRPLAGLRLRLGTYLVELSDSRLRIVLVVLIMGACAGAVEYAIHETLTYSSLGGSAGAVMDATVVGLAAAAASTVWLLAARERRKRVLRDLRKIAELNHQVRNALQVIAHSHYGPADAHTEMVLDSVERIERTIHELFPIEKPSNEEVGRRIFLPKGRHRAS